jgi:uncharacterized protein (TIGR00369 family)
MLPIDNPFLEWMGVQLVEWSEDRVVMTLETGAHLGNRTGRVHGGVMCSLLDAACGYAGLHAPAGETPKRSVSLSLTTHFIASGDGRLLTARGSVERKGRGIYFARGEIWLDDELLVATAIGAFKYLRTPAIAG